MTQEETNNLKYMYHITKDTNLEKIHCIGLKPQYGDNCIRFKDPTKILVVFLFPYEDLQRWTSTFDDSYNTVIKVEIENFKNDLVQRRNSRYIEYGCKKIIDPKYIVAEHKLNFLWNEKHTQRYVLNLNQIT